MMQSSSVVGRVRTRLYGYVYTETAFARLSIVRFSVQRVNSILWRHIRLFSCRSMIFMRHSQKTSQQMSLDRELGGSSTLIDLAEMSLAANAFSEAKPHDSNQ